MPLSESQRAELVEGSRISPATIEAAGLYSLEDPKACAKLFGWGGEKGWREHVPCLVFPYHLPGQRDPVLTRGKPAAPFERRQGNGEVKRAKYVAPRKCGTHLYYTPGLLHDEQARASSSVPLLVTEGEKKALSADSAGFACIGLGGVTLWHEKGDKRLHSQFAHVNLDGREVFVCFDRDALANDQVRKQELEFAQTLARASAQAFIVRFPEGLDKLDDYLAARGREGLLELLSDARKVGAVKPPTRGSDGTPAPGTALTDLGNAERFVTQHGQDLRFCAPLGGWHVWTGTHWRLDDTGAVHRRAAKTARSIYVEAEAIADDDARQAMRRHAERSESHGRLHAMVDRAATLGRVTARPQQWNSDPWVLNVRNGTLDLRTGELRPHRREDMITRCCACDYDPDASHDKWQHFLATATGGSDELEDFLRKAAGYSLTASTREDKLFFLYGGGGRGKSTFLIALESVLGSYAVAADFSTFSKDPRGGGGGGDRARPDLVRLIGARMVSCKEVEHGQHLSEGLVKTLTGGDLVTVRGLYSSPFEFRPTFKIWLAANDPPVARAEDTGLWRRVVRYPFDQPIAKPDDRLRDAFRDDTALQRAVLAWAVRGTREWLEHGMQVPEAVAASSEAYRSEMDPFGAFFEASCRFNWAARISRKKLYASYVDWCDEEGVTKCGARRFAAAVRERLVSHGQAEPEATFRERGLPVRGWQGVRLLESGDVLDGTSDYGSQKCLRQTEEITDAYGGVVTSSQIDSRVSHAGAHARAHLKNSSFSRPDSGEEVTQVTTGTQAPVTLDEKRSHFEKTKCLQVYTSDYVTPALDSSEKGAGPGDEF